MTRRDPLPWPIWVLALDVVGALLVALGIIGLVRVPETIDTESLRALSIAAIIIGVLLTLPFVVTVIRRATLK